MSRSIICIRRIINDCVYFCCKDCEFKSRDILEMNSHGLEHFRVTHGFPLAHSLAQPLAHPPTFKKRRVVSRCQMCGESFTNKLVANKHKRTCPALRQRAEYGESAEYVEYGKTAEYGEYDKSAGSEQQFLPDGTPLIHILDLARLTQLRLPVLPEPELRTPHTLMVIKAVCDQLAMLTPP